HQPASILDERRLLDPAIHGSMAWTLLVGVIAFTLVYAWLLIHRFRVAWLEERLEDRVLETALAERRAEGAAALVAGPRWRTRATSRPGTATPSPPSAPTRGASTRGVALLVRPCPPRTRGGGTGRR